jgi:nitrite reductase (NO-forming)
VVWSEHFAIAVSHAPGVDRRWSVARLATLTAGQFLVVVGVIAELVWLPAAGAVVVATAIAAHGVTLWRLRRRGLGGRLSGIVDYYLGACASLLAGAVLGGLLGSGLAAGEPWHSRMHLAHVHLNVGGWVLLTVVGTLFMLLPTTLRTTMAESTGRAMRWCLRLAGPGLAVAVAGLLLGSRLVAAVGVAAYLVGVAVAGWTFATTVWRKHPNSGSSWMLAAASGWLLIAAAADLAAVLGRCPSPRSVRCFLSVSSPRCSSAR